MNFFKIKKQGEMNMNDERFVTIDEYVEEMGFKILTPDVDRSTKKITLSEINRPALQLAGYYSHYNHERIQLIGNVEFDYLYSLSKEERLATFERLMATDIPCIVFTMSNMPDNDMLDIAIQYGCPVLSSDKSTSEVAAETIRWMNEQLAPMISIHGVLVDVFGEGILITGDSGIGKSEAALELIKRGHRLVSDDVVEIRKVSDVTLIGSAPEITKHFIELRGIGIVDVKTLFGIEAVEEHFKVGLVIKLAEWDKDKEYDRLGLEDEFTEYLGVRIPSHTIPVRPGRNLAIIVETAAINHRQRNMGYNAAHELYRRVQENLLKRK